MKRLLLMAGAMLISVMMFAQTSGTVTFKVTTSTASGQYAPKHVLAIWVTDDAGTFQKSLKVMAAVRKQYLYKWKTATPSQNVTDATTGATLTSHQTHTVAWNCKNTSNTVVADGNYKVWVEFTENDAQGPFTSYSFTKGAVSDTIDFSNATNFVNVQIIYTPAVSGIEDQPGVATVLNFPGLNMFGFSVPSQLAENAELQIFDLNGNQVFVTTSYRDEGSKRLFYWNADAQPEGMYIYRIESGAKEYCGKLFR